jgi:hypothetical protein
MLGVRTAGYLVNHHLNDDLGPWTLDTAALDYNKGPRLLENPDHATHHLIGVSRPFGLYKL